MTYPPVPYAVNTRCVVGLSMSTAVAQDGYAAATPCGLAFLSTRAPTTPSDRIATATSMAPRTGARCDERAARPALINPSCSERTVSAAIAIQGGTITATHSAVLRTDMRASTAPAAASAISRNSRRLRVDRRASVVTVSATNVSSSARSTHEEGSWKFGDCHSMIPFSRSADPVVAAKTKSDGPYGLIHAAITDAPAATARPVIRLRGATVPSDQRRLIVSTTSTMPRKPMPAMNPAWRFAQTRNSGGNSHRRRPPERRYDSAIQSVQQTSAKVNTWGRVPSTGSATRAPRAKTTARMTGTGTRLPQG